MQHTFQPCCCLAALPIGTFLVTTQVKTALLLTCDLPQDWLSRYGYLPPADPRTSKLQSQAGIEKAIRVMQRFGGVQETGVLGNHIPSTPTADEQASVWPGGHTRSCARCVTETRVMFQTTPRSSSWPRRDARCLTSWDVRTC